MQLWLLSSIICASLAFGDAQTADACSAPRSEGGPCNGGVAPVQKFYYDSNMGVCQPFMYKGCNGNANRFDTADKCKATCVSVAQGGTVRSANVTCPGGGAPFMVVNRVPAMCRSSRDCQNGYGCFQGSCCANKTAICSKAYDTGHFGPDKVFYGPRFYYSSEFKTCMIFTYYGYEGNANNFLTYNDCMGFCT